MSIAARLSFLLPKRQYQPRPRVSVNRRAREAMSRDRRWKKSSGSPILNMIASMLAGFGIAAVIWGIFFMERGPTTDVAAFPEFVTQVETTFPEAVHGYTKAQGGTLADGQEVPVAVTLLLPAHALESAAASSNALKRLSAPFVGKERAISGKEMGERIARLATMALPEGTSSCYTYTTKPARRVKVSQTRTLFVAPMNIAFNPEC